MIQEFVHYVVRPEKEASHIRLVQQIFAELRRVRPAGVKITVYQLGSVFIHVNRFDHELASIKFETLPSYRKFELEVADHLTEEPIVNDCTEINVYP